MLEISVHGRRIKYFREWSAWN